MEFPTHRSEEEVAELLRERDCSLLGPVAETLPQWVRARAEQPSEFWERQRAEILSRVAAKRDRTPFEISRAAWAMAAGVLVVASFLLAAGPKTTPSSRAQSDSDRELLMKVEYAVQSGGPQALEPAALLADEISQHQQISSVSPDRKEVNDEE